MRGTIPPGGAVPLHSHRDPETFHVLSGQAEVLEHSDDGFAWLPIGASDLVHIPGGAKHAFRTSGSEPAVMLITSTERLAAFFREIAAPGESRPPSPEALQRFLTVAERYGYWNATPAEDAAVGLTL
jgi:quercetin dioxygenase-like cupin family protein